jgi:hypothetical protein
MKREFDEDTSGNLPYEWIDAFEEAVREDEREGGSHE